MVREILDVTVIRKWLWPMA